MPPAFEAFRATSFKNEQGYKADNDMAIYSYAIYMPEFRNNQGRTACPNGTIRCHGVRLR